MTKLALAIALLLVLAGFCGCGGGADTPDQTFPGVWSGQYTSAGWQRSALGLDVQFNGVFSGVLTNNKTQESAILAGTIQPDGDLEGTVTYPDKTRTLAGNVRIDLLGHMVGSWLISNNGTPEESGTIDLEN